MEAIKHWEFEEAYSEQKAKISLFNDRVEMQNSFYKIPRIFNFNQVFENPYPLGNLQVDYELLKYMVIIVESEQLSEAAKPIYNFYKTFENNTIEDICIETNSKEGDFVRYFYTMTKYGIRNFYEREAQSIEQNNQRFSAFFFYGPLKPDLDFNVRKDWRLIIWKSLGTNPQIQKSQAFALFDYSMIKPIRYDYLYPEKDGGLYISINQGNVDIGGWSGRDGGSSSHSIEELWYNDSIISSELKIHIPEIRKMLSSAIVSPIESSKFIHPNPNEVPSEAPPA
jgi:hypothetical protein